MQGRRGIESSVYDESLVFMRFIVLVLYFNLHYLMTKSDIPVTCQAEATDFAIFLSYEEAFLSITLILHIQVIGYVVRKSLILPGYFIKR